MARQIHHDALVSFGPGSWEDKATVKVRDYINRFNALVAKPLYGYSNWLADWGIDFDWMLGSGDHGLLSLLQDGTLQTLVVIWMPYANPNDQQTLKAIIAGTEDDYIIARAQECKAFGYPIYMRFGPEFNISQGAPGETSWASNPADFVGAWRHVVDLFRSQGVTNVIWIWNPNNADIGPIHWTAYYPGDSYVDWVGIDTYQYSDEADPDAQIASIYNDYGARKPIGIFEWGANSKLWTGSDTPDATRASYVEAFFNAVEARPNVQLISYWYIDTFKFDTSTPLTLAKYRQRIANPIYIAEPTPIPPLHVLSIGSQPVSGIPFALNGTSLSTPYVAQLDEGTYTVSMPSNVQVGSDIYNFTQWNDGLETPTRIFDLIAATALVASYELQPAPPEKGILQVHAAVDGIPIVADVLLVETGQAFQTPATLEVDPGTYTLQATTVGKTLEQTAIVQESQTIRVDFDFTTPTPSIPILPIIAIGAVLLLKGK